MLGKFWESFHPQWRQSVRIVLSVLISQLIAHNIGLHEPYWALITAIVVTQIKISQTFSTARDQVIGTIIGAVAGILAILLSLYGVGKWTAFWLLLVPLAGLSAIRPTMRLAGVTLAVVFLFPVVGSPFSRPMDRVMAILTGVVSSIVVSFFILPANARKDALLAGEEMLQNLGILFSSVMEHKMWWSDVEVLNDACTVSMQKVTEAVKELRQEHPIAQLELYDPLMVKLPRILRRLQSDSIFIARASTSTPAEEYEQLCRPLIEPTLAVIGRMAEMCHQEAGNKPHILRTMLLARKNTTAWWIEKALFFYGYIRKVSSHQEKKSIDNKDVVKPFEAAFSFLKGKHESPLYFTLMIFEHDLLWLDRVMRTSVHSSDRVGHPTG